MTLFEFIQKLHKGVSELEHDICNNPNLCSWYMTTHI